MSAASQPAVTSVPAKPKQIRAPRPNTPILLTFRLRGSLPDTKGVDWAAIQKLSGREKLLRIDKLLDAAGHGPTWLKDERVAAMVCSVIESTDTEYKRYKLHAYVVMPNHVHLLVTPIVEFSEFLRRLKGLTAHHANQILGRTGPFWQSDCFDRWSRSQAHFAQMTRYIEKNPVWARLSSSPQSYAWSSAYRGKTPTSAT
jgi:REP element-mobilizing transposase RayT